jgi:hypothetical protein
MFVEPHYFCNVHCPCGLFSRVCCQKKVFDGCNYIDLSEYEQDIKLKLTFSDNGKCAHDILCAAKAMSVFKDTLRNVRMSCIVTTSIFNLDISFLANNST